MSAPAPTSVEELLLTADQLLEGRSGATPAGRHRGAAVALRTALEIAVDRTLDSAMAGLARTKSTRAKMLCLRYCTTEETARRAKALWSHLCLACHYHQYEIGPTRDQVRTWRAEVGELAEELTP
ncbi:hypothetical protein [Actinacidiphila sp. bgisy167]|uniref:hypothetical protein n=1 Tax=Actinacidiphila sp. bgisy167 TaxID=3413797 RepID=UPI003D722452